VSAALVAIYKDEAPYLEEWARWHRAFGFSRFLLYDNDSTDGGRLEGADVETVLWPGATMQIAAYRDALRRLRGEVEWAAFVDLDEFLWSPDGLSLATVLASFPHAANLWVPWQLFGWGINLTRPPGATLPNYLWRAAETDSAAKLGKSIVRPETVVGIASPHHFVVERDITYVTPLLCNHYFTRSREEALRKCARPRADTGQYRDWQTEFEEKAAAYSAVYDNRLAVQAARLL